MSSETPSSISSIPWKGLGSMAAVVGMLLLLIALLPKRPSAVVERGPTAEEVAATASAAKCEQKLARILDAMRPGSLGILVQRVDLTDQLNRWRETCGVGKDEPPIAKDGELLKKMLPEQQWERVSNERFLPQDASHIRLSLLSRAIVDRIARREPSDRDRVVALFDYVMKNVKLLPDDAQQLYPLTPYEVLLFGQGTADHQVWTFATLLRQMRLDAVILRPEDDADQGNYLVGAVLPRFGVLLFDPRLGMMIPSIEHDTDEYIPSIPATLSEAIANDQVFRQLDLPGSPYPLTSEALKDASVELVGDSSVWSPRMAELQFLLPSEVSVDVYDGLGQNELREPGQLQRVLAAGEHQLPTDRLSIWPFPGDQIDLIERAHGAEETALATLFHIFSGPLITRQDPRTGGIREGMPIDRTLHVVRMEQLMGDHSQALKDFLDIRNAGINFPLPINQQAAEFAEFWTGVSQFEQHRYDPAVGTFRRYVQNRQAGQGEWAQESLEWLTRCYLAMEMPEQAVQALESVPDGLRTARNSWLLRRWRRLLEDRSREPSETKQGGGANPADNASRPLATDRATAKSFR